MTPNLPKHIVVDIEGTTTPVSFITETLFPYARARLATYVYDNRASSSVRAVLNESRLLIADPAAGDDTLVAELIRWLDEDRKVTPLKTLQGMIWRDGYLAGELVAPVYEDVPVCLRAWRSGGIRLHVYSSGSVEAQQLLFAHTNAGSLLNLFDGFFDTRIGPKVDAASYGALAAKLTATPSACLFLTDSQAEVNAALEAGWQVMRIDRNGPPADSAKRGVRRVATSFTEVDGWLNATPWRTAH